MDPYQRLYGVCTTCVRDVLCTCVLTLVPSSVQQCRWVPPKKSIPPCPAVVLRTTTGELVRVGALPLPPPPPPHNVRALFLLFWRHHKLTPHGGCRHCASAIERGESVSVDLQGVPAPLEAPAPHEALVPREVLVPPEAPERLEDKILF